MKFTIDVSLTPEGEADPIKVADQILDYLCAEDCILDVISYDGCDPVRGES